MKSCTLAAIAALSATAALADMPAGHDRLDVVAGHRAMPVAASVWYPAGSRTYVGRVGDNPVFRGVPVMMGAAVPEGRMPLVLFSHGSGGNMDAAAWLGSALAARGAMVLAVNHPGSTSGDSSPRRSLRLDDRAADLSAALDALMADPAFAGHVDPDRIVAVGFSLGGATALGLAGLRFDPAAYADYCRAEVTRTDCAFFAKGGVDFAALPDGFGADLRDPRVSAAFAIDPAFGYVATEDSIAAMPVPVGLLNLGTADVNPTGDAGPEGSDLAARLPDATLTVVAPANHFTFLPACRDGAQALLEEEGEDPICDDPPATDREAVHGRIAEAIAAFIGL